MAGSKGKSGGTPQSKKKRAGRKRSSDGTFGVKQGRKTGKGTTRSQFGKGNVAPWMG